MSPRTARRGQSRRTTEVARTPVAPASEALSAAYRILCSGIDSVNSLASLYDEATRTRGPGAPTHEEQDLLRSMVVFAGAALDATTKQILRDALHQICGVVPESLVEAKKYVRRQLLDNLGGPGDRLAEALLHESPRKKVIEFVIDEVTGDSLQSVEQVMKAAALLGVQVAAAPLKPAFEARNQIIHEMDATAGPAGRRRRQRRKSAMWGFAKTLLSTSTELLAKTDARLSPRPS